MGEQMAEGQFNAVTRLGLRDLPALILTLAVGAIGGAIFNYFQLPLAWMLGAMTATTPLAVAKVPLRMDSRLRMFMIVVLGVMIGGTFSPAVVADASRWWASIVAMVVFVAAITVIVFVYFTRISKIDPATSIFSSLPGGLNEMAVLGASLGADDRTISLVHSVRIFLVVMTIPFIFQALGWYERGASASNYVYLKNFHVSEMLLIVAAALGGMAVCRLLRFPSPILIGAMLGSATIYASGFVTDQLPTIFIILSQIVVGSAIGARFAGFETSLILRRAKDAVGASVVMIASAFGITAAISPVVGFAFAPLLLAFAPGGFAEMSLIALALNIDTAYVSTHHIFRIFLIVLFVPILFRKMVKMGWLGLDKISRGDTS